MHAFALGLAMLGLTMAPPTRSGGLPLTLVLSGDPGMSTKASWWLSVNSAGQADLTVRRRNGDTKRKTFQLTSKQFATLGNLISSERFFELDHEIGEQTIDTPAQYLSITLGHRSHSVAVYDLDSYLKKKDPDNLSEPARAIKIINALRRTFTDQDAVTFDHTYKQVLDVVDKLDQ